MAAPSRKNSGFETTAKSASGRSLRMMASTSSLVPTGTVDLMTTTVASLHFGRDLARRVVDVGKVGKAVTAAGRGPDGEEYRVG